MNKYNIMNKNTHREAVAERGLDALEAEADELGVAARGRGRGAKQAQQRRPPVGQPLAVALEHVARGAEHARTHVARGIAAVERFKRDQQHVLEAARARAAAVRAILVAAAGLAGRGQRRERARDRAPERVDGRGAHSGLRRGDELEHVLQEGAPEVVDARGVVEEHVDHPAERKHARRRREDGRGGRRRRAERGVAQRGHERRDGGARVAGGALEELRRRGGEDGQVGRRARGAGGVARRVRRREARVERVERLEDRRPPGGVEAVGEARREVEERAHRLDVLGGEARRGVGGGGAAAAAADAEGARAAERRRRRAARRVGAGARAARVAAAALGGANREVAQRAEQRVARLGEAERARGGGKGLQALEQREHDGLAAPRGERLGEDHGDAAPRALDERGDDGGLDARRRRRGAKGVGGAARSRRAARARRGEAVERRVARARDEELRGRDAAALDGRVHEARDRGGIGEQRVERDARERGAVVGRARRRAARARGAGGAARAALARASRREERADGLAERGRVGAAARAVGGERLLERVGGAAHERADGVGLPLGGEVVGFE
jgi:hypothetical protein